MRVCRLLQGIFELFVSQLRFVSNRTTPFSPRYFHLLESLALVRSCLLCVQFDSHSLLLALFGTLLEVGREAELPGSVEFHVLDILSSCLDELEPIPPKLLDIILLNLTDAPVASLTALPVRTRLLPLSARLSHA